MFRLAISRFWTMYKSEMDYWYGDAGRFFLAVFRMISHPRTLSNAIRTKIATQRSQFKSMTVLDWVSYNAKFWAFMTPVLLFSSLASAYSTFTTLAAFSLAVITWWLFYQNASFTWSSRTRNANNAGFHRIAAWFSNGLGYVVIGFTAAHRNEWAMLLWYIFVTTEGSVFAVRFSQRLEKTKKLATGSLATNGDLQNLKLDFETETSRLHAMSILIYSRSLRKVRALRNWVLATFATKQELQDLKTYFEDKINALLNPQPVFRPNEEFRERQRVNRFLAPDPNRKNKPTPRWLKFDRSGQIRLGF